MIGVLCTKIIVYKNNKKTQDKYIHFYSINSEVKSLKKFAFCSNIQFNSFVVKKQFFRCRLTI